MPEENDFDKRLSSFMAGYKDLREKYKVDFVNYPQFIPADDKSFKLVVQSSPVDLNLLELNQSFIAKE